MKLFLNMRTLSTTEALNGPAVDKDGQRDKP
jgi:hypothetical protein